MAMSSISRKEYLREVGKQYQGASKAQKGVMLTAATAVTGLRRKSLIRCLRVPMRRSVDEQTFRKRGPRVVYGAAFHDALLTCWGAANDICAERLQPFLGELVPKLEACGELQVTADTRSLLLAASISTVARHLSGAKRRCALPLGTTKPGSLLKSQVAIRRGRWRRPSQGG